MTHRTKICINSATFDQLKALVGIGATYAQRIVEGRPYQDMDELVTKKVIPHMTYDKIKDCIHKDFDQVHTRNPAVVGAQGASMEPQRRRL